MGKFIRTIPKQLTKNNTHIRMIKMILGLIARVSFKTVSFIVGIPLLTFQILKYMPKEITTMEIFAGINLLIMSYLLVAFIIEGLKSHILGMGKVIIDYIIIIFSIAFITVLYSSGISTKFVISFVFSLIALGTISLYLFERLNLVDITKQQEYKVELYAGNEKMVLNEIYLGQTYSKFTLLKRWIMTGQTYFYNGVSNNTANGVIAGSLEVMRSSLNFKNHHLQNINVHIPREYDKSKKYYYGIIRYLLIKEAELSQINFTSNNQTEVEKAYDVLNLLLSKQELNYKEWAITHERSKIEK